MLTSPVVRPREIGLMLDEAGNRLPHIPVRDIVSPLAESDYSELFSIESTLNKDAVDSHFSKLTDLLQSARPLERETAMSNLAHLASKGETDDVRSRAAILLARNIHLSQIGPQFTLLQAKGAIVAQAIQIQIGTQQRIRRLREGTGSNFFVDYRRLGEMLEYFAELGPSGARGGLAIGDTTLDLEQIGRYAKYMQVLDREPKATRDAEFEQSINSLNVAVKDAIVRNDNFSVGSAKYTARTQSVHMQQLDVVSKRLHDEMMSRVGTIPVERDVFSQLENWIKIHPKPIDSTGRVIQSGRILLDFERSRDGALRAIGKHQSNVARLTGVAQTLPLVWAYANSQPNETLKDLLLQVVVERLAEIERERNCQDGQRAIILQVPLGVTLNADKVYEFEDLKQDLEKIAVHLMEEANREGEHQHRIFRENRASIQNTRLCEVLTPYYRQRMKMERFVRLELLLGLSPDLFKSDLEKWMIGIESYLDDLVVEPIPIAAPAFAPVVLEKIKARDTKGLEELFNQDPSVLKCRDSDGRGPLELALASGWTYSEANALALRFNLHDKEKLPKIELLSVLN